MKNSKLLRAVLERLYDTGCYDNIFDEVASIYGCDSLLLEDQLYELIDNLERNEE